jgi:peptidoglycan/xylan/chitin deacetylase (PgdA/CDA1 family)
VYFLLFFILIAVIYTIVPFILSRGAGLGVLKYAGRKAVAKKEIAFTFDDGPNPKYTNELLDLLKKHQIKASFFVVGEEAEKYPDIIFRMHKEGHLIGIHNYVHRSNWLMTPWRVKRDLEKSANIIEGITGTKPKYYRPPWGMLNIFDYFTHKDYMIILWSLMVGDWRSKGGSKKREEGILNGVKPGDIILLHDSGETWGANEDAPKYTITALKTVFKELSKRGYTCKRIDELN